MLQKIKKIIINILIIIIKIYQKTISLDHGLFKNLKPYGTCRFYPTCSEYMIQALQTYGFKGLFMGIKRVSRCHPLAEGGYDPIKK